MIKQSNKVRFEWLSLYSVYIYEYKIQQGSSHEFCLYPTFYRIIWSNISAIFQIHNQVTLIRNKDMAETKLSSFKDQRWSLQGMTALVTGGTRGIGSVL